MKYCIRNTGNTNFPIEYYFYYLLIINFIMLLEHFFEILDSDHSIGSF